MSKPEFDPFDPVSAAMGALHQGNLLAAKEAQIANLKAELTNCQSEADRLKAEVERLQHQLKLCGKIEVLASVSTGKSILPEIFENENLRAEVERLKAELADEKSANANIEGRMNSANRGLSMRNHLLQAEVERLRKVGDAMAREIRTLSPIDDYSSGIIKAWNAAKEGKQP